MFLDLEKPSLITEVEVINYPFRGVSNQFNFKKGVYRRLVQEEISIVKCCNICYNQQI